MVMVGMVVPLDVYEDGVMVDSLTLASGSAGSAEYCGSEGAIIEFYLQKGHGPVRLGMTYSDPSGNEMVSRNSRNVLKLGSNCDRYRIRLLYGTDCDDADAMINPSASEVCDGLDNDCNGDIDDGALNMYYADADNDGFGDSNQIVEDCSQPAQLTALDRW